MKKVRKKISLWLIEPSWVGVVITVAWWLFTRCDVRYRRSRCGPRLLCFIEFVNRWLGPIFAPILWPTACQNANGESLEYHYSAVVDRCFNAWLQSHPGFLDKDLSDAFASYVCGSLRLTLSPVIAAADLLADPSHRNIYLIRWSLIASMCKHFCSEYGTGLRLVPSFDVGVLCPLGVLAYVMLSNVFQRRSVPSSDNRVSVLIEYSPLNEAVFLGGWLLNATPTDARVVLFSTSACRPHPADLETMARHGWEHLPFQRFALNVKDIRKIFRVLMSNSFRRPMLKTHFTILFQMKYAYYKRFFTITKSRLLLQFQQNSWMQGAQRKAMADVGGIMAGVHWSNITYGGRCCFLTAQDIYFIWGRSHKFLLEYGGTDKRLAFYLGEWLPKHKDSSSHFEHQFVIAVFDSSVDDILQTPQALSLFHEVILDFLERTPKAGALLKPKQTANDFLLCLPGGIRLKERYSALESSGRVQWLPSSFSPVDAAKQAHLCVCFGINSAGVICSLRGSRSIHWDCEGLRHYFIYKYPGQHILYQNILAFGDALDKAASGDPNIGDFSSFQEAIDPFRDGQGAIRLSWFFCHYFKKLQEGLDAQSALNEVAVDYVRTWPIAVLDDHLL